ncbi:hypothetical protein GMA19_00841 [Paenibacillus polymyxa E681]|nr:hypothetical protein PPE_00835 [Paenibacillus polymyxa E681]QNV55689.1 hypothetical protein GE561_00842 [Paenibacillus polymyxa E681]QNV60525.1 hypothetical protein GMA19_00841 [Paenibacillus polymyxa E681]
MQHTYTMVLIGSQRLVLKVLFHSKLQQGGILGIHTKVNNIEVTLDANPYIERATIITYVPIRFVGK